MKIPFRLFVLWFSISLLGQMSCKSGKHKAADTRAVEQPKPGTDSKTDSLKYELDKERERRLKEKEPR